MLASSNEEIEDKDTQPNHPDKDLETTQDDPLDIINSQDHTEDQLDQVLQMLES